MPTEIYHNFEWDSEKRLSNITKHGFDFIDVYVLFCGAVLDKLAEKIIEEEKRYLAVGCIQDEVVAVVYTNRGSNRRIISVRKARDYERENYIKYLFGIKNRLAES